MRLQQVGDALVDGESATRSEDVDGYKERVEIERFPVPIGMKRIRRTQTALHSQQQEKLVARIHGGMHRFREHGRAARKKCSNILRSSNRQVRKDGSVNNLSR